MLDSSDTTVNGHAGYVFTDVNGTVIDESTLVKQVSISSLIQPVYIDQQLASLASSAGDIHHVGANPT